MQLSASNYSKIPTRLKLELLYLLINLKYTSLDSINLFIFLFVETQ